MGGQHLWPIPGRRAPPDIARQRLREALPVAGLDRDSVGLAASVQRFPHRLDPASERHVAHPHFPQRPVHVGEHRVEHGLGQLRPGRRLFARPLDQQGDVQADHVESAVQRVGHAERGIEIRVSRRPDCRRVERKSGALMPLAAEQAEHPHPNPFSIDTPKTA